MNLELEADILADAIIAGASDKERLKQLLCILAAIHRSLLTPSFLYSCSYEIIEALLSNESFFLKELSTLEYIIRNKNTTDEQIIKLFIGVTANYRKNHFLLSHYKTFNQEIGERITKIKDFSTLQQLLDYEEISWAIVMNLHTPNQTTLNIIENAINKFQSHTGIMYERSVISLAWIIEHNLNIFHDQLIDIMLNNESLVKVVFTSWGSKYFDSRTIEKTWRAYKHLDIVRDRILENQNTPANILKEIWQSEERSKIMVSSTYLTHPNCSDELFMTIYNETGLKAEQVLRFLGDREPSEITKEICKKTMGEGDHFAIQIHQFTLEKHLGENFVKAYIAAAKIVS